MKIVKNTCIYKSSVPITEVGGSFSDLSLWAFWRENGVLQTKALHKSMVTDANGAYLGSLNSERWTGSITFSGNSNDSSPCLLVTDGEVKTVVWERNGQLYYAPQTINSLIRAADCALTTTLDSGMFTMDFVNKDEIFTTGDYAELFENEKSIGFEAGYNGEYIRLATSQADSSDANKSRAGSTFNLKTKNKFYDLLQMGMTKNYQRRFAVGETKTIIEDYALTRELAANGGNVEIRIDAPNGIRWVPGSVSIANLTGGVTASKIYGQTEFFAFVRLTNTTSASVIPTFDVIAHDNSDSARRVGRATTITGESVKLNGTTPVRLKNKSIDGSVVGYPSVIVNGVAYVNGTDYSLTVDSEGYTTIARTAADEDSEGNPIPDGSTATVGYTYISSFKFSVTFNNTNEAQDFVSLYPYSQPESYQMVVTSVTGASQWYIGHTKKTIGANNYFNTYRPLHVFYTSATNGAGLEIILNQPANLTVTFEIWARPMEMVQSFGDYMTVKEIFRDLAKMAVYKDLMFYEYADGTLEAGQFTSLDSATGEDLFIQIEEEYDTDTLRIENTGTTDVNFTILESGYIIDNDHNYNYGVRVAVTRAYYSVLEISKYAFQIWGQYTNRKDFLPPFPIEMKDIPDTKLTAPLRLKDVTIEEAMRKLLQICFYDGHPYRMFAGPKGQLKIVPYKADRLDKVVHTFKARNVAQIAKKRQIPLVIDRVEVKGPTTSLTLVASDSELAHNQDSEVNVPYNGSTNLTIDFGKLYNMTTYEFRNVSTYKADIWFTRKTPSSVTVKVKNTSSFWHRHNGHATFEIWAKPISAASFQEDYIYKTDPNIGGKYTYTKASIDNELIINSTIGGSVADNVITESCQDYLYLEPGDCPANPALEQIDTVKTTFSDFDDDQKGIIKEIDFSFDGSNSAKLTMNVKIAPRVPFAAGYGSEGLTYYDDDSLADDYELGDETDDARMLYNQVFG